MPVSPRHPFSIFIPIFRISSSLTYKVIAVNINNFLTVKPTFSLQHVNPHQLPVFLIISNILLSVCY